MDRIVFSGRTIDRLGELRARPDRVAEVLTQPGTRFLPVWRGQCLVQADRIALLRREEILPSLATAGGATLLGRVDSHTLFCIAVDDTRTPAFGPTLQFAGLRDLSSRLSAADATLAAYAKAMIAWQQSHRHCGVCGTANELGEAGFVMSCPSPDCGHRSFPRLDPAIIVLVANGERCLLGRQHAWPENRFSTIAGFVEPAESLEDAVRREVREETDVEVGACHYLGSQPWPFPAALMVGFHARATSTSISCNDGELAEARWVTRADIAEQAVVLPPAISIAYRLIEAWFDRYDGPSLASLDLPGH